MNDMINNYDELVNYIETLAWNVRQQIENREYGTAKEYYQLIGQSRIINKILERIQ